MIFRTLTFIAIATSLSACQMSGTAEKGPFKKGAKVSIAKINNRATPIVANKIDSNVYSNSGQYSINDIDWNGWSQLEVTGQYFNEFSSAVSTDEIILQTITKKDRTFDRANIHLLSHLAAARIKQRVDGGQSVVKAWKNTQKELKTLFGLRQVNRNIHRGVEQLSLSKGTGVFRKDNANLLLFTGSFLATGGNQESLDLLTKDFADDGQFNGVGSAVFSSIASMGATDGLLQELSNNLKAHGIYNPPNKGDMKKLPIWVNQNTADTVKPVVTVTGQNPVTVVIGTPYVDEGATATDNVDGVVTAIAVNGSDVIDTATVGTHTVIYNATDAAGNIGDATRTVNVVEAADIEAPVITLTGGNSHTLEVKTGEVALPYQDPGYTATDNRDQSINVSVTGTVNTAVVGTYELTYSATDTAGNDTIVTRTVNVVDTTKPVITLNGAASVEIIAGSVYVDAGAIATDNYDQTISAQITENTVDTTVGSYIVTYTAIDSSGNQASVTRTVKVTVAPDETAPVITLKGNSTVTVEAGTSYTDAGATATDNKDGDITSKMSVGGSVNTSVPATYLLTYSVNDSAGNSAVKVTRTVVVKDTVKPVITLVGNSTVTLVEGTSYTDAGATAQDSLDGNITANIVADNTVNTAKPDTYTITYNVADAAGNNATPVTRTVIVMEAPDETAPVITLKGNSTVTVEAGTSYTDAGATASDNKDGDITSKISVGGSVNTSVPATYLLTYSVSDAAGNPAVELTRTVIVKDTTAPVITLVGNSTVTLVEGTSYTDAGATALDSLDGDITNKIIINDSSVDTTTPGTYTVTYNVVDAADNNASQVTRTVIVTEVLDVTVPHITLTGQPMIKIAQGANYTDAGAIASDNKDGDITNKIVIDNPVDTSTPGSYTVTYNVVDAAGNSATQVTRTVIVNNPPVPVTQTITVEQDSDVTTITLEATDEDAGDSLDFAVITEPSHGTIDGTIPNVTYKPNPGYFGSDSFNFSVNDGTETVVATINITVTQVIANQAPTAVAGDDVTVRSGEIVTLTGVASSDSDGTIKSYLWTRYSPGRGTVTEAETASFNIDTSRFDPATLVYTLKVTDDDGATATDSVKVTILPPLDEPKEITFNFPTPLVIETGTYANEQAFYDYLKTQIVVIDQEGNPINDNRYHLVLSGESGPDQAGNYWDTFNPNAVGYGFVNINYVDNNLDPILESFVDVVINQGQQNHPPVADTQATIAVTQNSESNVIPTLTATDLDGDTLTFEDISGSTAHGALSLVNDGTGQNYLYTPDTGYIGLDSFTFIVNDGKDDSAPVTINIEVVAPVASACTATLATEAEFEDTFITSEKLDTPWPNSLAFNALTVDDIANVFNAARSQSDHNHNGRALVMPTQDLWDGYTDSQKALYLINSERCIRGIRPYEGISPTVVTDTAQYYADFLASNSLFAHDADGRSPFERLSQLSGVNVNTPQNGGNADFFARGENLAYTEVSTSGAIAPKIHEPVAKAVYAWIYKDKQDTRRVDPVTGVVSYSYGHREFILARNLVENSGEQNKEGLIGVATSTIEETINGGGSKTKVYTIMNGFDPNEGWLMNNIQTVDLLESTSCLSGYQSVTDVATGKQFCIPNVVVGPQPQ